MARKLDGEKVIFRAFSSFEREGMDVSLFVLACSECTWSPTHEVIIRGGVCVNVCVLAETIFWRHKCKFEVKKKNHFPTLCLLLEYGAVYL